MSDINNSTETMNAFLQQVKPTQVFWALQDKASEDWVVLDSPSFENTDVMPLWSTANLAQEHCIEEWSDYVPCEISVAEWLEFWVEDLNEDGVIVGVNWQGDEQYLEMELAEFTQGLASIESFK
ncbi:DUF2750 domain-containing protein [Colwellia sp. D2M02]|uniref:DUF2750 domain-containing protein n=1 Tax=Colwellia sp. D2M02 TaxID=2841562 RepID=UPI001C091FCD|nr:DUF2750 domain-containing protein [Colwellia sp. D2M02]MBU2892388.1 DUF2750 domain-containing protein [Colwellia sp. D2M02]